MRIGVDMLGLQSPDSRLRGVGRYGKNFLEALLALDAGNEYVLYAHDGLPADQFPESSSATVVTLRPEPALGEFGIGQVLDRLIRADPDALDVLLLINPFEQTPYYAPPARPLDGPALVAVVHDLIPFLFQERYLKEPSHARPFYRHLEKLRHYDLLLTNSEATRADCLRMLGLPPERVVTISAAGQGEFFRPDRSFPIPVGDRATLARLGVRGPFLFSLSGRDERKNLRGLIDAFRLLPLDVRERHQLVVTCEMTEAFEADIRAHADRRGVSGRLVLTGPVDDETLRVLYQRCAAFAFPSTYEGFGLPILEAMHCGAPVVAGNNSSQVEVVGDGGLLANAEDAADVAAKLEAILTDVPLAESLRARAVVQAGRFSWMETARRAAGAIASRVEPGRPATRSGGRTRRSRPRLAMFSPWPPKASGISDYAARLVRELAAWYAIDLYHDPGYVPDLSLCGGDFACFDARLFPRNERVLGYRGVVHQMGNSFYHRTVYEGLRRHRGIVVHHDFCLAGFHFWYAHQWPDPVGYLRNELAYCYPDRHEEYAARIDDWMREPGGFQEAYARRGLYLNRRIFDDSEAVVVHSPWCLAEARRLDPAFAGKTFVIPHGSEAAVVAPERRAETRSRFGLPQDALIVGSFGYLTEGKMNEEALAAFASLAREEPRALYLFVGQDYAGGAARRAASELGILDRVRFLGRQPAEAFEALQAVVDIGISLRRPPTYGETSGALLHLLRHGVATIVNDVGTFADYPDSVVRKVRMDAEGVPGLTAALMGLARDDSRRRDLGRSARRHVAGHHAWPRAAGMYADLIERVYESKRSARARSRVAPGSRALVLS